MIGLVCKSHILGNESSEYGVKVRLGKRLRLEVGTAEIKKKIKLTFDGKD